MFLSRAEVPWQRVRNAYDLHREIWRLFPRHERESRRKEADARDGFLFRIEESRAGRPVRLLIQSRVPPQATLPFELLGVKEIRPEPRSGQNLYFVLTANPIRSIIDGHKAEKADKSAARCRVPLVAEDDQRAWIARKLKPGAEVRAVSVVKERPVYFRKDGRGGKIVPVTFNGLVSVTDSSAFVSMLENGIGPGKAFGCGLILVRRA